MADRRDHELLNTEREVYLTDRRRPGRPEHVSPELIPLLRGQYEHPLPPQPDAPPAPGATIWSFLTGLAYTATALVLGTLLRFAI